MLASGVGCDRELWVLALLGEVAECTKLWLVLLPVLLVALTLLLLEVVTLLLVVLAGAGSIGGGAAPWLPCFGCPGGGGGAC